MAGGIADGKEDGLVLRARFGEGLVAPREPVDGVVGVLKKVGGFFAGEAVRGLRRRHIDNRIS
jgi:hypothetical protein